MSSAYLQPPRIAGGAGGGGRINDLLKGYQDKNRSRMCGICGVIHAPGEPHKTRRGKDFNHKTGMSRLTVHNGGSVPARTRGTEPDRDAGRPPLRAMMATGRKGSHASASRSRSRSASRSREPL